MAIAHRRIGTGPVRAIVLHDWFGTSANWGSVLDHLDPREFSYAFLDYRGYGDRRDVVGRYDLAEIADDVLELADQLGWDTFSLLGHSMGGKAAQQVLVRASERIERLIGVNPVPAGPYPMDDATHALFHGAAANEDNRRAILDLVTGNRPTRHWIDRMAAHSMAVSLPEAFAAYLASWESLDLSAAVKGNTVPVLVLVGEYDPALGVEVMRATWQAWYPHCRIQPLPGAGHYPPHETPVAFTAAIEAFLRG
ncbi:alpha/beta hydrolase [Streptomyces sp. NBC_00513]|uniref:alpha/beta fold hydrolase n=1 Tax=unclassified Streptomyces TaxID=2593676 RepID=UPI00224E598C|nr:alpha/beta hydrolase [Streptomyces sp. NBC_00424]MCX5072778.1 alpha/beta hydrolase [Streptomyces sp. NBC_00424]WUD43915.1 alpha/beta hydrolase [Streptomyces sp. NBC_00513]